MVTHLYEAVRILTYIIITGNDFRDVKPASTPRHSGHVRVTKWESRPRE